MELPDDAEDATGGNGVATTGEPLGVEEEDEDDDEERVLPLSELAMDELVGGTTRTT
ncbi:MAG: hypothetical protein GAK34_03502 [Delftia tsuruhatensis]|nr:MAG: hypothetical protein GAK34_03502 [Delftia tsuruhatensis]